MTELRERLVDEANRRADRVEAAQRVLEKINKSNRPADHFRLEELYPAFSPKEIDAMKKACTGTKSFNFFIEYFDAELDPAKTIPAILQNIIRWEGIIQYQHMDWITLRKTPSTDK